MRQGKGIIGSARKQYASPGDDHVARFRSGVAARRLLAQRPDSGARARYSAGLSLRPHNPKLAQAALPKLDWWRGFRSRELTGIVERARDANLDIAAAVARIVQADAQARVTGAALLPIVDFNGSATHSRSSQSHEQQFFVRRIGTRQPAGNAQRQLRNRLLGQEPRGPARGRGNRGGHPLRQGSGGAVDGGDRRQCLFPGAGGAGPPAGRAREPEKRQPRARPDQAAAQCRHRFEPRSRAAGKRGQRHPRQHPAAATDADPDTATRSPS